MGEVIYSTEHLAKKVAKEAVVAEKASAHAPLWEKHRELMKMLTLGVDIASLHNNSAWSRAQRVLEIGCGKGKFLEALLDYFPEKEYVGIDISKRSKEDAEAGANRPGTVSIIHQPLHEVSAWHHGRYDVIFVHSLAGQIKTPDAFFQKAYRLLRPGGSLFFYEMNDERTAFRPDPGFGAFFEQLPELREALCPGMRHWQDLVSIARSNGLGQKSNTDVVFPSSYGDNKRHLTKIVNQLLELAERSDEMEWNFATARRSLQRWSSDPSSFGQFAVRRVVFRRPGGILSWLFSWLF